MTTVTTSRPRRQRRRDKQAAARLAKMAEHNAKQKK